MFKSLFALTLIAMVSALQSPPMPVDMFKLLKAGPKFDYGFYHLPFTSPPPRTQFQAII